MKSSYWFIKNILSRKEVNEINSFIENNYEFIQPREDGSLTPDGKFKKNFEPKSISWGKIKSKLENALDKILTVNDYDIGCDLFNIHDTDHLLLNEYTTKKKYDWHIDGSGSEIFHTKLTVLINMSTEPYSGGKFELMMNNQQPVPELDKTGNAVIFRSHTPHRVTPVTKGTRKSLTFFLSGPRWR